MFVDKVRLFIFVGELCLEWVVLAHFAKHLCGLHIPLVNQFFVVSQSIRNIFGLMPPNKTFLTTDHHLWTDLIN